MELFEGTVRMPGDPFELSAVLQVVDGRLRVTSQQHELGSWALEDVSARLRPDGCHVVVDGEEMIVTVPRPVQLAEAIGLGWTDPADDSLLEAPTSSEAPLEAPEVTVDPGFIADIPLAWKLGTAAAVALVALWVFLPTVLVGLVVIGGIALLLGGTMAVVDPFTSVRLPERLTAGRLLAAGGGLVAVGLAIALSIA